MFQIAAAIGYAKSYGYRWRGDSENKEVPGWYSFFPKIPRGHLTGNRILAHDPRDFNFKQFRNVGNCQLHGFFQSYKYFAHCEDEVKEVFSLPRTEGYLDYCSIHVRRGDYVKYRGSFPPVSVEYIQKAMSEMKNKGIKKFIVFSDDINWCKQHVRGNGIEYSEGKNEFEDLSLMASCGNHITANSTFSWWGAWLGINPNKHVISPSHKSWFGRNNGVVQAIGYPKDIIPDNWQQIDF